MILINFQMDWIDRPEVKKGMIGEKYVQEFLGKKGFIIYKPITEGSHKIDFFTHHGEQKRVVCVEVKAKRRMAKYQKTGFNYDCYLQYKELWDKHKIPTYVFFIDDFEECIYGNWLNELGEGWRPPNYNKVIVWDLDKMKFLRKLTPVEIFEANQYTKENYDYSKVSKYFLNNQLKINFNA